MKPETTINQQQQLVVTMVQLTVPGASSHGVAAMNRISGMTHRRRLLGLLPLLIVWTLASLCLSEEVEIAVDGTTTTVYEEEPADSTTTTTLPSPQESGGGEQQQQPVAYGVDASWPMHHHFDVVAMMDASNTHHPTIRTDLADVYGKYMTGCYETYSWEACEKHEEERLALNLNQPPLMRNFTAAGYAKVQAPRKAFALLSDYFQKYNGHLVRKEATTVGKNEDADKDGSSSSSSHSLLIPEKWPPGNVYTNHWETNTEMNHLDMHLSSVDKETISSLVQATLEKWTGVALVATSMYGIRVYRRGSILAPHVDRLPLVISAIINVAQGNNGEEPWPLEVIGHDGIAVNITMEPGEMILYESHSVIHGRPFPLQADYFANVFLHFEPIGYSYEITQQQQIQQSSRNGVHKQPVDMAKELYEAALAKHQEALSSKNNGDDHGDDSIPALPTPKMSSPYMATRAPSLQTPPYITTADETSRWRQEYVYFRDERKEKKRSPTKTVGATAAHVAAAAGDLITLKEEAARNPGVINQADENGWKPIHEAARGGRYRVIQWLIEQGVDVNERTHHGSGGTPLWWAEQLFPEQHLAIQILKKNGAKSLPPQPAEK